LFHKLENYEIVNNMRVNRKMIMLGLNFINLLIHILGLVLRILIINWYYHILLGNIIRVQMMSWFLLGRSIVDFPNYWTIQ